MRPGFQKYRDVIDRLIGFCLISLAVVIPLFRFMAVPCIALLLLLWLLRIPFIGVQRLKPLVCACLLLFIAFYLYHFVGLIMSDDIGSAHFDLEVKMSIAIFPFVFMFLPITEKTLRNRVLTGFVTGNILACLICIGYAIYRSFQISASGFEFNPAVLDKSYDFFYSITHGGNYFFYNMLSFFRHPAYFSMYLVFALIIVFELIRKERISRLLTYILWVAIPLFLLMLLLLSSRAGFITAFVVIGVYLMRLIKIRFGLIWMWASLIAIIGLAAVATTVSPRIKLAFNEIQCALDPDCVDTNMITSSDSRFQLWRTSGELISDNWILGVGNGDIHQELNKRYSTDNNQLALNQNLNVHNQYLESFAMLGIVGFLLLLAGLISALILALRRRDIIFLALLAVVMINAVFESILDTQSGVVFLMFFISFLATGHLAKPSSRT